MFHGGTPGQRSMLLRHPEVKAKQKVDMSKQLRASKNQGRVNGIPKHLDWPWHNVVSEYLGIVGHMLFSIGLSHGLSKTSTQIHHLKNAKHLMFPMIGHRFQVIGPFFHNTQIGGICAQAGWCQWCGRSKLTGARCGPFCQGGAGWFFLAASYRSGSWFGKP